MPKRQLVGTIISDKMQKTVVVNVERVKEHAKYRKRYRISKNYKAHVDSEEYKEGDKVLIEECKPISKDKKWRVISKLDSAGSTAKISKLDSAASAAKISKLDSAASASKIKKI